MLIRFSAENFGSFRERAVLSMMAGRVARHPMHVTDIRGRRVLRSSFAFGANAGGKSTLVKAMDFAQTIIKKGLESTDCTHKAFRLGSGPKNEIGVFQFDLSSRGHFYSYGFAISYLRLQIVSEWLYLVDDPKSEVCVFQRDQSPRKKTVITTALSLSDDAQGKLALMSDDFQSAAMGQVTFLSDMAKRNAEANDLVEHCRNVRRWFDRLIIISPDGVYGQDMYCEGDGEVRQELGELLNHFDTGIKSLRLVKVDEEKAIHEFPPFIREALHRTASRALEDPKAHITVTISSGKSNYIASFRKGVVEIQKLVADHGNARDLFDRGEESDGTRRLFGLLPLLLVLRMGAIVVIDEIDRSLHTQATREFIRLFLEENEKRRGQLVATTHDGELLDLDFLRQDEIWFVERGADGASRLYPLSQFKARFDKDVKKDYLLGRYGALPIFSKLDRVDEHEKRGAD